MSKKIHPWISDENVVTDFKEYFGENGIKKVQFFGEMIQKSMKLLLMVSGHPKYQNDNESNDLLNTYINSGKYAHTNEMNMIKAIDTTPMSRPSKTPKLTTKKDRAYYVLNYLKSIYPEEFTFKEYLDKSKELLERANDDRTIATNIELLEKDGAIAWIYDRYSYEDVLDEEGEIDPNKRKLTNKQRFKFTYNTQLIKENPYYLKDKTILKYADAIKRYVINVFVKKDLYEVTDNYINEFAYLNGFKNGKVWISLNVLMYQGFLNLTKVGKQGTNIYAVNSEAGD